MNPDRTPPRPVLLPTLLLGLVVPWLAGCVVLVGSPFEALKSKPGLQETVVDGEGDAKLLVIDISGFISDQPTDRAFGLVRERSMLDRVQEELEKAAEDEQVKALVLRINSPGGGVTASDEIYHRIRRYREETGVPVVAALGSVAASGGYYIACAAQEIVAHPTTVTGSVGVIILGVNLAGLMQKLGVENQTYRSGEHKDLLSPLRGATEQEQQIMQSVLDSLFTRFADVVRQNRPGLNAAAWESVKDGRIFASDQALQHGLVDASGRLHEAIARARELAGLERARVIMYHQDGAKVRTVYSRLTDNPATPGLAALSGLSLDTATTPQFLYLWRPGLAN